MSTTYPMVCRRCAVYVPSESVTFNTGVQVVRHIVEVHGDRAAKLLGALLAASNDEADLIADAVKDHNAEGDYDPDVR